MQTDYWNSLDYESQFRFINPRSIGVSSSIVKKGLDQLKARIFEGASTVELGFMGKGKGSLSQGGVTPEMHSKEEREELRQLAKINEVDLSTHTTVALGSVSGLAEGGFRPEVKEEAIHELKRTIDFAADVARGGPIVVHTGEFPRPISAAKGFEAYPEEEKRAVEHLVDEKTGQVITSIRKDIKIPTPVWKKNEKGKFIDEAGKVILDNEIFEKRVPIVEKDKIKTELRGWKDLEKEKEIWNRIHPDEKPLTTAQFAYTESLDSEKKRLDFESGYRLQQAKRVEEQIKALEDKEEEIKELVSIKAGTSGGEQRRIAELKKFGIENPKDPEETKKVFEHIKETKDALRHEISSLRTGAVGFAESAKEIEMKGKRAVPLGEFGIKESADALARSAIYAYDKERTMKLEKPLFIAPENIFPEQYGAHPQELKELILKSRNAMAKELHDKRNISQSEANKIAADHIKATFDVGHANTWKKYFKGTEKEFKSWMTNQVETLQKEGIIGHVHLSDNFGYYDEHLAPGEGNVPIKELAEKLEKHGYKGKFIAEWGAQPEAQSFRVMTGAWNTLSSPVYKIDPTSMAWTDIEGSYFGRTGSPTYLVGDDAPSKDWTLWSETQLE